MSRTCAWATVYADAYAEIEACESEQVRADVSRAGLCLRARTFQETCAKTRTHSPRCVRVRREDSRPSCADAQAGHSSRLKRRARPWRPSSRPVNVTRDAVDAHATEEAKANEEGRATRSSGFNKVNTCAIHKSAGR
eukprot:6209512-Pleurochrysis_carterae.AAC.2